MANAYQQPKFRNIGNEEGLSSEHVNCITQDKRGFMWFATPDGLNRWDGYRMRTFRYDPNIPGSLGHNGVTTVLTDKQGILWAGCMGGYFYRFNPVNETFTEYEFDSTAISRKKMQLFMFEDSREQLWIASYETEKIVMFDKSRRHRNEFTTEVTPLAQGFCEDKEGNIWLGGQGGLAKYQHDRHGFFVPNNKNISYPHFVQKQILSCNITHDGSLWVSAAKHLYRVHLNDFTTETYTMYPTDTSDAGVANDFPNIIEDKDSTLWLASWEGLVHFNPRTGQKERYVTNTEYPNSLRENTLKNLFFDRSGTLWIGTDASGVSMLITKPKFTSYRQGRDTTHMLWGENVRAVIEDKSANVWVGIYDRGASYFNRRTGTFNHLLKKDGIVAGTYSIAYNDATGDVYFGTDMRGIYIKKKGSKKITRLPLEHLLDVEFTGSTTIIPDSTGFTFSEFVRGIYHYDLQKNTITNLISDTAWRRRIRKSAIQSFIKDHQNNYWIATLAGGVFYYNPTKQLYRQIIFNRTMDTTKPSSSIFGLAEDADGRTLWVGTSGGLFRFDVRTGSTILYGEKDGFQSQKILSILQDVHRRLWLGTKHGLVRFNPITLEVRNYDISDGLPSNQFNTWAYSRGASGRLYFGTAHGYTEFYPDSIRNNPFIPPIVFTNFSRNNTTVVLDSSISVKRHIILQYKENNFNIEFAALSFQQSEKNRYAYILEGFDSTWIDNNTSREARYTNIPPGEYRFRVRASNNDGVWNDEGKTLFITIRSPWWQTLWAYFFYSTGFVGGMVFWRRTELHRQSKRFLEIQRERELTLIREKNEVLALSNEEISKLNTSLTESYIVLEHERKKTETLLLNILPASIATRLKAGETVIADKYQSVSILFADIVGFTTLSSHITPERLVKGLNEIFSLIDQLVQQHNLEKIKTIGDAYMIVAGVPEPRADHAQAILQFAFDLQNELKTFPSVFGERLQLRIGIHSGDVVAGVIGKKKFTYDVWGDAVNMASRMESHGESAKIHVSEPFVVELLHSYNATLQQNMDQFEEFTVDRAAITIIYRGEIDVKGKGKMKTYFLEKV